MELHPFHAFDLDIFFRGECQQPFSGLGMHLLADGVYVRTFQPEAQKVALLEVGGKSKGEMRRIHEAGLFEIHLPQIQKLFPYRFQVQTQNEEFQTVEDPYRFLPVFQEGKSKLFSDVPAPHLHGTLGAHPRILDGVEGVAFAVWAPQARRISVVGHFNHWDGRRHLMQSFSNEGIWELFIPGLKAGDVYKFEILGQCGALLPLKADPFAFRCEHPPSTASIVHDLNDFSWSDQDWMNVRRNFRRDRGALSIYQIHAGSWRRHWDGSFLSYQELAEQLVPYVREMGFTHIQLLPICSHPFYHTWGFQPLSLFAPSSRYGAPQDFKHFVNECHRAGIGVILDWLPSHFPTDDHGLAAFDGSCLYERPEAHGGLPVAGGEPIYDFHRREVQDFLISNALFWLEHYHIDGLRMDALSSVLYLDHVPGEWVPNPHGGRENLEAVAFFRRLNLILQEHHPDCLTVAEENSSWPMLTQSVPDGGMGFGYRWHQGWKQDVLHYFQGHMIHRRWHHDELLSSLIYPQTEHYILPLGHEEVVYGKRSLLWKMPGDDWERFANLRLLLAFTFIHPGRKLIFMGGEFGQEYEWNHNSSLDWHLLERSNHLGIQSLVRDLNRMYRRESCLQDKGFWDLEWIDGEDRENSVLSLIRQGQNPDDFLLAVLNFTGMVHRSYRLGVPDLGLYQEVLNSDSHHYGGSNVGNGGEVQSTDLPMHGFDQSIELTLPPLGAIFLKLMPKKELELPEKSGVKA